MWFKLIACDPLPWFALSTLFALRCVVKSIRFISGYILLSSIFCCLVLNGWCKHCADTVFGPLLANMVASLPQVVIQQVFASKAR